MIKTWLFLLLVSLLIPCAGANEVFKWTDEDGIVHFSDQPRDWEEAERVELPRFARPESEPSPDRAAQTESESGEGEGGEAADAKQRDEIRTANCNIARRTLERNQSIQRMFRLGPDGERQFLSDEEREQVLQRNRDDVAEWCD